MQKKSVKKAASQFRNKIMNIRLDLPFDLGETNVVLTEKERLASWALFVEMSTRISTQAIDKNSSSVREALASLHQLFGITRAVLKDAGPEIGQGPESLGPIAIKILNDGLRPFLSRWHADYRAYEVVQAFDAAKKYGLANPPIELVDQADWPALKAFYKELEATRKELRKYVNMLAMISGVQPLSE